MLKVLIVEDDLLSAELLENQLEQYGFMVHKASNGSESVEMFRKEFRSKTPYDLIFMDIIMPGIDGLEAVKKIREFEGQNSVPLENETKIIMATAEGDKKIILKSILQGRITGYLTKPIDLEQLNELIQKCINPLKRKWT